MNLPHQKPIRFVEEILEEKDEYKIISCAFPYLPTLAMICEAAAQSSASFSQGEQNLGPQIGFLISLKDIKEFFEVKDKEYELKIEKSFNFGTMTEFFFELRKDEKVFVSGSLTIALSDKINK